MLNFLGHAGVAQLVEHDLAKVGVASSNLVSRFFNIGVWLNLARAPALGAGGCWFKSSHPDFFGRP